MSDTQTLAVPEKVKLTMTVKAPKKGATRNSRTQYVGRINDGAVRAKVYTDRKLESLKLKVSEAETKDLEHGEQRLTWDDKDNAILVIGFIPLAERGNVTSFKLTF